MKIEQVKAQFAGGRFEVDGATRILKCNGKELDDLPPQPVTVLCYLIANRNRYISNNELINFLDVTDERSIHKAVSRLRKALGEMRTLIKNKARCGYRFYGEVNLFPPSPASPVAVIDSSEVPSSEIDSLNQVLYPRSEMVRRNSSDNTAVKTDDESEERMDDRNTRRQPGVSPDRQLQQLACFAFQLGYTLVEMGRYAQGAGMSAELSETVSPMFQVNRATAERLCKFLEIDPFPALSLETFDQSLIFSYYNSMLGASPFAVVDSYQIGRNVARILVHLIPDFAAFTVQGESRATKFLQLAHEDLEQISSAWRRLFHDRRSVVIERIQSRLEAIKDTELSLDNVGPLVSECNDLGDALKLEFEHNCKMAM